MKSRRTWAGVDSDNAASSVFQMKNKLEFCDMKKVPT